MMDLTARISSEICKQIPLEADKGFHIESITVSDRIDGAAISKRFDCAVFVSPSVQPNEFCLSLRSSPSVRRVEYFRITTRTPPDAKV